VGHRNYTNEIHKLLTLELLHRLFLDADLTNEETSTLAGAAARRRRRAQDRETDHAKH
jgi:hypothetical protein